MNYSSIIPFDVILAMKTKFKYKTNRTMNKNINQKSINMLLNAIKELNGDEIITIFKSNGQVDEFDMINSKFTFGSTGLEGNFAAKVHNGMAEVGAIIVRQLKQGIL